MTLIRTTLILIATLALIPAVADEHPGTVTPLFTSNDLLEVTIRGPFSTIMQQRANEEDIAATLSYRDAENGDVSVDLGIQARGRFRRQREVCRWAPLRLNFKKSKLEDTIFAGSDKMKLVTHCRNGSDRYTQTLLIEHLAYRIFNLVTDASFRVRLLRITYVDTDDKDSENVELGFLIEHKDQVAVRLGLDPNEVTETSIDTLDARHTNLSSVYQYLIGNTDFSPIKAPPGEPCCHNYALFGTTAGQVLAIPYDFDMSGIVDAPYASPNPRFGLRNVRERLYRGRCVNNENLDASLQSFKDQKDAIYALVDTNELFRSGERKDTLRYLDSFFETIENPDRVRIRLTRKCLS